MVDQIYGYADPSQPLPRKMFTNYLAYFSNIRNNAIKMDYIKHVPEFVNNNDKANIKTELDKYLKRIENENWELSITLIWFSQTNLKVEGLVNYAELANGKQ